jgi:rhodanese-related sulfurtransferase
MKKLDGKSLDIKEKKLPYLRVVCKGSVVRSKAIQILKQADIDEVVSV